MEYHLGPTGRRCAGVRVRSRCLQTSARARIVARHRELRAEAENQHWYLIVQREAMGLRHHGDIYELYRLPAAIE